jgi:hypothetical protein
VGVHVPDDHTSQVGALLFEDGYLFQCHCSVRGVGDQAQARLYVCAGGGAQASLFVRGDPVEAGGLLAVDAGPDS